MCAAAHTRPRPAVLGCTEETGHSVGRAAPDILRRAQPALQGLDDAPPVPLTPPSITGQNREKRGLSERSEIASSAAPILAEKRREPLASARGKSSGVLFFDSFLLDKQKK